MKNLKTKLLSHLEQKNHINPNPCQHNVISRIDDILKQHRKFNLLSLSKNFKLGIYIYGAVGVGKSILLKALKAVYPDSKILHFNELIFYLQAKTKKNSDFAKKIKEKKLIIVDEFFINNLTSLILFDKFLSDIKKINIPLIMSGNTKLSIIYNDPVNQDLCKDIQKKLEFFFLSINIKSKVDYRVKGTVNSNYFFLKQPNFTNKQNLIVKRLSKNLDVQDMQFKRKGNNFTLENIHGNLIDVEFEDFFSKNFVFQDYEIISKKIKFFVIRNIIQMDENSKNLLARFISFVDVVYENKNILSISSHVELENLYIGKTNSHEFKRTISRLKEIGSNTYINKYIKLYR